MLKPQICRITIHCHVLMIRILHGSSGICSCSCVVCQLSMSIARKHASLNSCHCFQVKSNDSLEWNLRNVENNILYHINYIICKHCVVHSGIFSCWSTQIWIVAISGQHGFPLCFNNLHARYSFKCLTESMEQELKSCLFILSYDIQFSQL